MTDQMADHWWWRPGWQPGRRMYTWHFTFDGQPGSPRPGRCLPGAARRAPRPRPDPGPLASPDHARRRFHRRGQRRRGDRAHQRQRRERLKGFAPQRVTLGPARVTPEAILLDVAPAAGLAGIRHQLREAIRDALGAGRLMEGESWTPHVSVAYSNGTGPQAPYAAALEDEQTADTVIGTVELIVLGRDNRLYEWTTRSVVPLPGDGAGAPGGALR